MFKKEENKKNTENKQWQLQKTALLPPKNLAVSLLFSIFLGPLGLFYASLWGGIGMFLLSIVVFGSRLPGPMLFLWVACTIWSVVATQRYNNKIVEARIKMHHEEKNRSSIEAG